MKNVFYYIIAYAAVIFCGGLIGFFKAGSIASLIMSSIFTLLLLLSALGVRRSFVLGFYGAFALALALSGFFAYRYFLTQQLFPGGFMLLLSTMMVLKMLFTKAEAVRA